VGRDLHVAQVLGHHEAVFLIGDDYGRPQVIESLHAQQRVLQETAIGGETQELLGQRFARQGPQPGAGAAGKYDGIDVHIGILRAPLD
jgi:hypothetical protein